MGKCCPYFCLISPTIPLLTGSSCPNTLPVKTLFISSWFLTAHRTLLDIFISINSVFNCCFSKVVFWGTFCPLSGEFVCHHGTGRLTDGCERLSEWEYGFLSQLVRSDDPTTSSAKLPGPDHPHLFLSCLPCQHFSPGVLDNGELTIWTLFWKHLVKVEKAWFYLPSY